MATDPRIASLRKIARQSGWQVGVVTRAKRRAPIALRASRIYRAAWQPSENGSLSQYEMWEYVEVNVDDFDKEIRAGHLYSVGHGYMNRVDSLIGVAAIEAALLRPAPATTSAISTPHSHLY